MDGIKLLYVGGGSNRQLLVLLPSGLHASATGIYTLRMEAGT
jgi:hypothetical protein